MMKSKLWVRIAGATLALCLFGNVSALAVNTSANSTDALMQSAVSANEAESEAISYELYQHFTADTEAFLREFASQPESVQQTVAQFIVWENAYDAKNLQQYLSNTNKLSEQQKRAADILLQYWVEDQSNPVDDTADDESTAPAVPKFDVEVIRGFIDQNLTVSDPYADEEFCKVIAQAYAADPVEFGAMISDLDNAKIERIGQQISYAVKNQLCDITLPSVAENSDTPTALHLLSSVIQQDVPQKRLDAGTEDKAPFRAAPRSTYTPSIGTISYSGSLEVGKTSTLSVTISETAHSSAARSYYIVAMCSHSKNGTYYKKAEGSVSIPAGSTSAKKVLSVTMSEPGSVYTKILVYSSSGGTLLASRIGANPDPVKGYWRIQINLNSSSRSGYLGLYNASGSQLLYLPCLGKSESNAAEDVYYGNTPRGDYYGYLDGPNSNTHSYGPYKYVVLEGNHNPLVPSVRDGIWIHGGDPSASGGLRVTHGCVRVSNANQLSIQNNITTLVNNGHYTRGNVKISVGNY